MRQILVPAAEREPARAKYQSRFMGRDALRMDWGVWPNARKKLRRMRSLSPNPVPRAMVSTGSRPCSSMTRAASRRRFSTAFAGDIPVSRWNTRLNWRGLKQAASASF